MNFENVIQYLDYQISNYESANSLHEGHIARAEEDIKTAHAKIEDNNKLMKELRGARKLLDAAFDAQLSGPVPGTDYEDEVISGNNEGN